MNDIRPIEVIEETGLPEGVRVLDAEERVWGIPGKGGLIPGPHYDACERICAAQRDWLPAYDSEETARLVHTSPVSFSVREILRAMRPGGYAANFVGLFVLDEQFNVVQRYHASLLSEL